MVWPWQRRRGPRTRADAPGLTTADAGSPWSAPDFVAGLRPVPSGRASWAASDIRGRSVDGEPVELLLDTVSGPLLLCFLSTDCLGCQQFWQEPDDPDGELHGIARVIVVKEGGPEGGDGARALAAGAAPSLLGVVVSDEAWLDYRVTGYPHLVLVNPGQRTIEAETVGLSWDDARALVRP